MRVAREQWALSVALQVKSPQIEPVTCQPREVAYMTAAPLQDVPSWRGAILWQTMRSACPGIEWFVGAQTAGSSVAEFGIGEGQT
jgi:hypothetical protein